MEPYLCSPYKAWWRGQGEQFFKGLQDKINLWKPYSTVDKNKSYICTHLQKGKTHANMYRVVLYHTVQMYMQIHIVYVFCERTFPFVCLCTVHCDIIMWRNQVKWSEVKWVTLQFLGIKVPCTLGWPYTWGTWLCCDYFIWCVSCTLVVLTCFVTCE
jgi:hypothetical protein